jgi:hypothetical protein
LDGIDFAEAKEKEHASSLNFFYESLKISDHQQKWPWLFPGAILILTSSAGGR